MSIFGTLEQESRVQHKMANSETIEALCTKQKGLLPLFGRKVQNVVGETDRRKEIFSCVHEKRFLLGNVITSPKPPDESNRARNTSVMTRP